MRLLIASDGSAGAGAAVDAALRFPWPQGSRARGVVALGRVRWAAPVAPRSALARALHAAAEGLRAELATRWPEAWVVELHQAAADAILSEAARFRPHVIALGWRGHGAFARLLAGSVSRAVAERAACSVLVARRSAHVRKSGARRFVVGFDGSDNSRKAIRFMSALQPPPGNRVVLVSVVDPPYAPSLSRASARMHAGIRQAVARQHAKRLSRAQRRLNRAAAELRKRGWRVGTRVRSGAPLERLLREAEASKADVLVVGARGAAGLERTLFGSVASGALNQSPLPVVIAR